MYCIKSCFQYTMVVVCTVLNCKSKTPPLHKFPQKDFNRLQLWVAATGNTNLMALSVEEIRKKRICFKHFEEKYKLSGSQLSSTAVPTLCLPGIVN